jgi:hypothetical protein
VRKKKYDKKGRGKKGQKILRKKKKKKTQTKGGEKMAGRKKIDTIWAVGAGALAISTVYLVGSLGYGVYLEWPGLVEKRKLQKARLEEIQAEKARQFVAQHRAALAAASASSSSSLDDEVSHSDISSPLTTSDDVCIPVDQKDLQSS